MYNLIKKLDKYINFETASAHCDVPCGIYDPVWAQISALTVVRMMDLIEEVMKRQDRHSSDYLNKLTRLITVKEEHAEKVKHEIRIIWGDFFKTPDFEKYPGLNELTHDIMVLASQCRQSTDRKKALELVEKINAFAEIFWAVKGQTTVRSKAPYAPNLELVYRKV